RLTYGVLGPLRKENELRPGDSLVLSFTIEGLRHDAEGKVRYTTSIEVTDDKGKVIYTRAPKEQDATCTLGGHQVPAYVRLDTGFQQPEGDYTIRATITDLESKKSQTLTHKTRLLKRDFGVVRITLTNDPEAHVPTPVFGVGQSMWVNATAIGFARD